VIVAGVPYCEVCGVTPDDARVLSCDRTIRIDFPKDGGVIVLCALCRALIDSGLLRFEGVDPDGVRRYRRWNCEWTPGELFPAPLRPAPSP
jgi:hypothetical protein